MMKHRCSAVVAMLALTAGCQSSPPQQHPAGAENTSGVSTTSTAAAGAGSQQKIKVAMSPLQSGFLPQDIYPKLEMVQGSEGTFMYIDKSADYRPFRKVMFEPTEVYLIPNPYYKGLPREALMRMTTDFQNAFVSALAPDYVIVHEPGPDVLRVRSAITGVQPADPNLSAIDYVPVKALFNVGRKAVGVEPQVAEMSAELQILAPDGKVIGAAKATRKGDKHLAQGEQITWNQMQSIANYWARNFRQRLDELRGVVPPNVG